MSETKLTFADASAFVLLYTCAFDGDWNDDETKHAIAILVELMVHFDADQDGDGDVDVDDVQKSWSAGVDLFNKSNTDERAKWAIGCLHFLNELLGDDSSVFASRLQSLVEADGVVTQGEEALMEVVDEILG